MVKKDVPKHTDLQKLDRNLLKVSWEWDEIFPILGKYHLLTWKALCNVSKQSLEPHHKRCSYQGQRTDSSAVVWTYREWMHICPFLEIAVLFCHFQETDVLRMTLCSLIELTKSKGHTQTHTYTLFCQSCSTNFKTDQFNARAIFLALSFVPLM